jgi:SRSO17 transposase
VFVSNNRIAAVAAAHSVDADRWWTAYGAVIDRIAPRFKRYESLRHVGGLMLGMLASLERKNCWTIAEYRGDVTPDGLQHLLARAVWDADGVRDDLRGYVIDAFAEDVAVLVVDETGDVKKVVHSAAIAGWGSISLALITVIIKAGYPYQSRLGCRAAGCLSAGSAATRAASGQD